MTLREMQCLTFIRDHYTVNDRTPSLQQIADHLGLKAKSNAHRIVRQLEALGFVERTNGRRCNIVLTQAAGAPALAAFSTEALRAEIARRRTAHG